MKRLMLFVIIVALVAVGLSACAKATPQVVEKTVVVTKEVEKVVTKEVQKVVTKEVEKVVTKEVVITPTPAPQPAIFRTAGGWSAPPAYHGNRFAPGGVGAAWWWVYEPLFYYVPGSGEIVPALAASFEDKKDHMVVHLQPNAVWHDGKPFTSKDVWTTIYLRHLQGAPIWKFLDRMEMPDDHTVVFYWKNPTPFAKQILANELITSPYHIYGKWAEQVANNMDNDDELAKIRQDLANFKPEKPIGTGPFVLDTVTASEMILSKFPKHYEADKIAFDGLRILRWSSNEVVWAYLMADEIDVAHPATPKDVTDQILARQPEMKLSLPTDWAEFGIVYNWRIQPFSDYKFRKAMTHVIDRKQMREVTYYFAGDVDEYAHNILMSFRDKWLSKDFLGGLTSYEYNPDKAEAMLKEMGYKRGDDGNWLDPNGNPLSFELNAPAGYSDWVIACDNLATQLTNFGFPTECRPLENAVYWPKITTGDYQIALEWTAVWWGYGHPWAGFQRHFLGDTAKRAGIPEELPGPDGNPVNLEDLVVKMGSTFDEAEMKKLVQEAAWISNEHLIAVPYLEKRLMMFHNEKHITGYPDIDDPLWTLGGGGAERAYIVMMRKGLIKPKR